MITKEYILNEIKRTAKENDGQPLGKGRFENETGIKETDWSGKYWTKWGDALIEAGYEPNKLNQAYDEKFLIESMIELIIEIKKYPTLNEIKFKAFNSKNFPYPNTFKGRLGKKHAAAKIISEYCEARNIFPDVIDICKPIFESHFDNQEHTEAEVAEDFGYVYLMKSGKYYKIGKSNSVGRRNYELNIQLPEKIEVIHEISTDDPAGVEEYWHKRFADKRKNGEWFDLAIADVSAFRRRKFM